MGAGYQLRPPSALHQLYFFFRFAVFRLVVLFFAVFRFAVFFFAGMQTSPSLE
jgi:hypothetical protein